MRLSHRRWVPSRPLSTMAISTVTTVFAVVFLAAIASGGPFGGRYSFGPRHCAHGAAALVLRNASN